MGRSGSGKTTLLSLMAGLELPDSGQVCYRETPTSQLDCDAYRRDKAAVIYQSYNLFPLLTAEENAAYPLRLRGEPTGKAIAAARSKLSSVGLTEGQFRPLSVPALRRRAAAGGHCPGADRGQRAGACRRAPRAIWTRPTRQPLWTSWRASPTRKTAASSWLPTTRRSPSTPTRCCACPTAKSWNQPAKPDKPHFGRPLACVGCAMRAPTRRTAIFHRTRRGGYQPPARGAPQIRTALGAVFSILGRRDCDLLFSAGGGILSSGGDGMTVYVDLLFGLNTFLNYLLLRGAAAMGGVGKRTGRLVGAAAVGGLYAVLTLLPGLAVLAKLPGQAAAAAAMAVLAFGWRKSSVKLGLYFLALSFALSGVVLLAVELLEPDFKAPGRKSLLRRLHPGAPSAGGAELRPGGTGAPGRGQAHRRRPRRPHPHFGGANGDPPGAPGHGQHSPRPPHRRGRGVGRARRPCGAAPRPRR